MASIGRIQLSGLTGTQETQLSLFGLNFDFSLMKVEAPAEYCGVGNGITLRCREAAEGGTEHVFARRLGALFATELPKVPNLIRAYGRRASEIIASPIANPKGTHADGMFREWIGADATSLWAAATSGDEAIAVHLLACMLARMWKADEAVAIWDEIITTRRENVANQDPTSPVHLPTFLASKVETTREQMARWDASARSWLEVADCVKLRQQKQLILVVTTAGIDVFNKDNVYNTVMKAWKLAMVTLDRVIEGVSHQVQDAAVILGLASWHLYPDLYVLSGRRKLIENKDDLITPEGVITIGASTNSPDNRDGVSWSMPLSCLKFYGDPVITKRSIGTELSRLNIDDFWQVLLGSAFGKWFKHAGTTQTATQNVCDFLIKAHELITPANSRTWLHYFAQAARKFILSQDRVYLGNLVRRGRTKYSNFLVSTANHPAPFFGLCEHAVLSKLVLDTDKKIELLRSIAKKVNVDPFDMIIRYPVVRRMSGAQKNLSLSVGESADWEYASAFEISISNLNDSTEHCTTVSRYVRWTDIGECDDGQEGPYGEVLRSIDLVKVDEQSEGRFSCRILSGLPHLRYGKGNDTSREKNNEQHADNSDMRHLMTSGTFWCVLGDQSGVAIFKRSGATCNLSNNLAATDVIDAIKSGLVGRKAFIKHFEAQILKSCAVFFTRWGHSQPLRKSMNRCLMPLYARGFLQPLFRRQNGST